MTLDKVNREWLQRNRALAAAEPGFRELFNRLRQLRPNSIVVAYAGQDDFAAIAQQGQRFAAYRALSCRGEPCHCHANVAILFSEGVIDAVCSGFAYTASDRMWRQHSWGWLKGFIVETTVRRQGYFGVLYDEQGSREFARAQGIETVERGRRRELTQAR